MQKLVAMVRVKDGILFVKEWLNVMEKLVDDIVVVDNGSTDGTLEILKAHSKVVAIESTIGFDEGRDKILVYEMARKRNPDWCIWLDIDEIFEKRLTRIDLERMMLKRDVNKYVFRRFHLHKDLNHFEARFDKLLEQSVPSRTMWREHSTGYFRNIYIHNGDIQGITGKTKRSKFRLKHLGAVDKDYLTKKTKLYQKVDKDLRNLDLYQKNLNQNLRTWPWYEYMDNKLIVNLQLIFLNFIYFLAKAFFYIKRKLHIS